MNKILFFLIIFVAASVLGLYVGSNLIPEVGDISPITGSSVDDVSNSFILLIWIIFSTASRETGLCRKRSLQVAAWTFLRVT